MSEEARFMTQYSVLAVWEVGGECEYRTNRREQVGDC